jgi:hypothetical protein
MSALHDPANASAPGSHSHPAARPPYRRGEAVEGWVTAEITPFPRPLRVLSVGNGTTEPQFAPPEARFVLAVVEYPSGPAAQWGSLRWPSVDIVLRSHQDWLVAIGEGDAPQPTPELQFLVEELAQRALDQGWQAAGRGRTWCSRRFRKRYEHLQGHLRWR